MTLPNPVKQVLSDERRDQAVVRTWVRLQRTRRTAQSRSRLGLAVAGLASAACGALLVLGVEWRASPRAPDDAPAQLASATLKPTVTSLLAKGRQTSVVAPKHVVAPAPRATPPTPVERAPVDEVKALLDSAAEAVRAQDYARAAALLGALGEHHPDDPRTPVALFALGKLQVENLHQRDEAARNFTRALELNPPEELVVPLWKALQDVRGPAVRE